MNHYTLDKALQELQTDLKSIQQDYSNGIDVEMAHLKADNAMLRFFNTVGCTEIVELYNAIHKWYS